MVITERWRPHGHFEPPSGVAYIQPRLVDSPWPVPAGSDCANSQGELLARTVAGCPFRLRSFLAWNSILSFVTFRCISPRQIVLSSLLILVNVSPSILQSLAPPILQKESLPTIKCGVLKCIALQVVLNGCLKFLCCICFPHPWHLNDGQILK